MNQKSSRDSKPRSTIAILAPLWLQDSISILLQATSEFKVIAKASNVEDFLSFNVEQPPDLVLLNGNKNDARAENEVIRIKKAWPSVCLIVLIEHVRQKPLIKRAGADQTLIKGISPQKLLDVISHLSRANNLARR